MAVVLPDDGDGVANDPAGTEGPPDADAAADHVQTANPPGSPLSGRRRSKSGSLLQQAFGTDLLARQRGGVPAKADGNHLTSATKLSRRLSSNRQLESGYHSGASTPPPPGADSGLIAADMAPSPVPGRTVTCQLSDMDLEGPVESRRAVQLDHLMGNGTGLNSSTASLPALTVTSSEDTVMPLATLSSASKRLRRPAGTASAKKLPVSLAYSAPPPLMHMSDSSSAAADLESYPILDRYVLVRSLGRGTFSVVKLGRHLESGHLFALKIMTKKTLRRVARLENSVTGEIALLQSLKCPRIVQYVETIETSTHLCIVMEAVLGGDLYEYLEKHSPLAEATVATLFRQLVEGVKFLHGSQVCHRDLKLENILLTTDGQVKIGDFGLATRFHDGQLLTDRCGSEEYAAPEIILGRPYDGRAVDIWALGVILFALACGSLPFNADPNRPRQMYTKICCAQFTIPATLQLSAHLVHLVGQLLNRCAEQRATIDQVSEHPFLQLDYIT